MDYEKEAMKYKPDKIKYLFIAESPPKQNEGDELRYFYFEKVAIRDSLLRSIVEVIFSKDYKNKEKRFWLNKLKEEGFFLIDAVEYPINHLPEGKGRNDHLIQNFPDLIQKIKNLVEKDTKIILIKKNIFLLLFEKIKSYGFNVINTEMLDFPSRGHQPKFKEKLKKLLMKEH